VSLVCDGDHELKMSWLFSTTGNPSMEVGVRVSHPDCGRSVVHWARKLARLLPARI